MENEKPFCDIELESPVCSADEYNAIVERMIENANRDLKFSDTEVKMSALDLYNYVNYRCHIVQIQALELGAAAGIKWMFGVFMKIIIVLFVITMIVLYCAGLFS